MATILIVQDCPNDRQLLATVLRTGGHQVIEASDDNEALRTLTRTPVHLVISDVLMPTVDGVEFVRRLRETPAQALTPVMFCTAAYHAREAHALARQCGVVDIVTKPATSDAILARIDRALPAPGRPSQTPIGPAPRDRDHLRLVGATRAGTTTRFEMLKERMAAIDQRARQFVAERDPWRLFNTLCSDAREITLAQYAVVGVLPHQGFTRETLFTSGVTDAIADRITPPPVDSLLWNAVVGGRRPVRVRTPTGHPDAVGWPLEHPPVSSLLTVPIASPSRVFGWLSLHNKLGADEFTADDEHAVVAFGIYAGMAYEHLCQIDHLHRRISAFGASPRSPRRDVIRPEERTRLVRMLHEPLETLVGLQMDLQWHASPSHRSPTDVGPSVESMLRRLKEAIQSVRTITTDARPSSVETHPFLEAHDRESKTVERRHDIHDGGGAKRTDPTITSTARRRHGPSFGTLSHRFVGMLVRRVLR